MVNGQNRLVSTIAATAVVLATAPVANAADTEPAAEQAVLVPGATVFKPINPLVPILGHLFYPIIGVHFHDDDDPEVIDYSQNALAADRAIREGVEQTLLAVRQYDGEVVVIGESMGSMVASRVARTLADSAKPPAPEDIRFVLIAPPEAGAAEYFPEGTFIPLLNYRVSRVPESPYPTTVVIGEYDFWADPPDRPWNLPALVNALLGTQFVHGPPIADADPADVADWDTTVDGNVTTHLVPTKQLPATELFRIAGVPDKIVDRVDRVLRPVIDAGYRRHDKPGDPRPYLSEGKIHRNVQSQQQVRKAWQERRDDRQERRENRRQHRQEKQAERLDRVEQRVERLKQRIERVTERRMERRVEQGVQRVRPDQDG